MTPKLNLKTNCNIVLNPSKEGTFSIDSCTFEPDTFKYNQEGEQFNVEAIQGGNSNISQSVYYDNNVNMTTQVININSASNIQIGDVSQNISSEGSFQQVNGVSNSKEKLPTIYIKVPVYTKLHLEITGVGTFKSTNIDLGYTEIEASGSTSIYTSRIFGEAYIDLSGDTLCITTVCGDVNIDMSGTSSIELWGNGEDLIVDSSGASEASLNYECLKSCKVNASGCSEINNFGHIRGKERIKASGVAKVKGFD